MTVTTSDKLRALINQGVATKTRITWGRGTRQVIILGGKKYQYNDNTISRILKIKILSMYIDMPVSSSNQNIVINDVLSGDVEDNNGRLTRRQRIERRKNVKTIQRFAVKHKESIQQTPKIIDITVRITFTNPDSNKEYKQDYTIPTIFIKGGKNSVATAIKKATRELAEKIGSYPRTVTDMELTRVLINDAPANLTQFKDLKLYGTLLSYHGYNLVIDRQVITLSCVIDYIIAMLNNPDEPNRNKRIMKLTRQSLMAELGMTDENEGCTLNQLIMFFDKHKITYYAVDFRFFTVDHNKNKWPGKMNNLPTLYFMISSNHLYPIIDKHTQASISHINGNGGGKLYTKKTKPEELVNRDKTIYRLYNMEDIDDFINNSSGGNVHLVSVEQGMVNALFEQFVVNGDIYNTGIKVKNHKIVRFEINGMIVEENQDYEFVTATIKELNTLVKSEKDMYVYREQSLHRLAMEYFNKEFNNDIYSFLSPEVMDILEKCMKAPVVEFYNNDATVSYDKNKCYANILKHCDKFGWARFTAVDEVQPYDGKKITAGLYYLVIDNDLPFHGNDFYIDNVVQNALDEGLITKSNIKYQIRASDKLKRDYFMEFVNKVFEHFREPKKAIVAFIGAMFGRNRYTISKDYFDSNLDTAMQAFIQNPENVSVRGIYDSNKIIPSVCADVNMFNVDNVELGRAIQASLDINKDIKPVAYHINVSKQQKIFMNALIIQKKIYDNANWEMYEVDKLVKQFNPNAVLCGRKVDLMAYSNAPNAVPTSDRWGGIKLSKTPKPQNIITRGDRVNKDVLKLEFKGWQYIDDANINDLLNHGGLVTGMAGTGKSTHLNNFKKMLVETRNEIVHKLFEVCAPTHKACKIIGGKTLHRLFGIHPIDYTCDYKTIKRLKQEGTTHILIDEVSMISSQMWGILAHIQRQYGFIFIGFGDFKQLKPVKEEHINFENLTIIKTIFNYTRCHLTTVHRFNDDVLLQDAHTCANGGVIDKTKYGNLECDLSIAWSNECVNHLNKRWNEHYAQGKEIIKVHGNDKTTILLYEGLELVAYRTPKSCVYSNAESLVVVGWKTKNGDKDKITTEIELKNDDGLIIKLDSSKMIDFRPAYSLTVHKAQGMSIDRPYTIYEHEKMMHDMLYVALTRTRKKEYVNFGNVDILKPYTGSIYRISINDKSYIGCAKRVKERWLEHKSGKGNSKFIQALKHYGHKAFKWEVLETINFCDINDLYRLEDSYIDKYNSIECGFNTRYNIKQNDTEIKI